MTNLVYRLMEQLEGVNLTPTDGDTLIQKIQSRVRSLPEEKDYSTVGGIGRQLERFEMRLRRLESIEIAKTSTRKKLFPEKEEAIIRIEEPWLLALDYCMAIAREIGMVSNAPLQKIFFPAYGSLELGVWKIEEAFAPHEALFRFGTQSACDRFIRTVGQDRLNLIFGIA